MVPGFNGCLTPAPPVVLFSDMVPMLEASSTSCWRPHGFSYFVDGLPWLSCFWSTTSPHPSFPPPNPPPVSPKPCPPAQEQSCLGCTPLNNQMSSWPISGCGESVWLRSASDVTLSVDERKNYSMAIFVKIGLASASCDTVQK